MGLVASVGNSLRLAPSRDISDMSTPGAEPTWTRCTAPCPLPAGAVAIVANSPYPEGWGVEVADDFSFSVVVVSRSSEVTGLLSLAANILRRVWSRTNTCSHAKRKLRAYDSCTELGSASAYLWRNLSSRSTTSLPAAHAVGIVAAKSLTKIRVQTIQGRPPRDAKKCCATTVLGRPERH